MEPNDPYHSINGWPIWNDSTMSEAPKMIYVPTGILPSAIDRYEAGETFTPILTAFGEPFYEDDYAYRRADIPWLREDLVERLERVATSDGSAWRVSFETSPTHEGAPLVHLIRDILNALKEGDNAGNA